MDKLASRNISLAILLIVILVIVLLFRNRTPYGKGDTAFASMPQKEITIIDLEGKDNKILLAKSTDGWTVNGKNEARHGAIAFIERILTEMKIKSPVSPELFVKEITDKNIEPVKVRVFGNRRLINSFLVYKTGSNIYGNIMKVRESSKPYIVSVPGFEGDIGSAFTLNELFWLPYTIFNLLPSEISSISCDNKEDPSSSFMIRGRNKVYTFSDGKSDLSGWDTTRVRRYISYFTLIPFESWALDLSSAEADSIKSGTPMYRIGVTKTDGTSTNLTLWEKKNRETGLKDSDRLWGKTDSREDLFILRYFDIDPLLKKRSYFYED